MFLIGAALATAGGVGVLLRPGERVCVVLALLSGAGVGIAGVAVGSSSLAAPDDVETWGLIFFISSIAGFVTVAAALTVAWRRARSHLESPGLHPEERPLVS